MSVTRDIVLFDAFETLGTETAASRSQRFTKFRGFPSARRVLASLPETVRVGVFSLDPQIPEARLGEALAAAGLVPPIVPDLVAIAEPNAANPFDFYLSKQNLAPERIVFVSMDAGHRAQAKANGFAVAPHVALTPSVLADCRVLLVRVVGRDHGQQSQALSMLPAAYVLRTLEPEPATYALVDDRMPEALAGVSGLSIEFLGPPDMIAETTLIMLNITPTQAAGHPAVEAFLAELGRSGLPLFEPTARGHLIAWPFDRPPRKLHPPPPGDAHGHSWVLRPSSRPGVAREVTVAFPSRTPTDREKEVLAGIDAASLADRMKRWGEAS